MAGLGASLAAIASEFGYNLTQGEHAREWVPNDDDHFVYTPCFHNDDAQSMGLKDRDVLAKDFCLAIGGIPSTAWKKCREDQHFQLQCLKPPMWTPCFTDDEAHRIGKKDRRVLQEDWCKAKGGVMTRAGRRPVEACANGGESAECSMPMATMEWTPCWSNDDARMQGAEDRNELMHHWCNERRGTLLEAKYNEDERDCGDWRFSRLCNYWVPPRACPEGETYVNGDCVGGDVKPSCEEGRIWKDGYCKRINEDSDCPTGQEDAPNGGCQPITAKPNIMPGDEQSQHVNQSYCAINPDHFECTEDGGAQTVTNQQVQDQLQQQSSGHWCNTDTTNDPICQNLRSYCAADPNDKACQGLNIPAGTVPQTTFVDPEPEPEEEENLQVDHLQEFCRRNPDHPDCGVVYTEPKPEQNAQPPAPQDMGWTKPPLQPVNLCRTDQNDCYKQCQELDKQKNEHCKELNRLHVEAMKAAGCKGTKCSTKPFGKTCRKRKATRKKRRK